MSGSWSASPSAMQLRTRVLGWLNTMRAGDLPGEYRLNTGVAPTVFASCFAVYLRHLFDDRPPTGERQAWLDRILAYQDPVTGLFVDPGNRERSPDATHDAQHLDWQLTTFCLSAVNALGGVPMYPLAFVDAWTPDRTREYLSSLDWTNPWNSGNKAMFLGIALSCHVTSGSAVAVSALEAWFDWHDAHRNPAGFWGLGTSAQFIDGMGGAYHQFLIYRFWQRPIGPLERIVDRVLFLQQPDGLY